VEKIKALNKDLIEEKISPDFYFPGISKKIDYENGSQGVFSQCHTAGFEIPESDL